MAYSARAGRGGIYHIFHNSRQSGGHCVFSSCGPALSVLFARRILQSSRYAETPLTNGGVYEISGTVKEKSLTEDGEYVKIKNISADGEDVGGVMIVYLDEDYGQFCDVGYSIKFKGTVYAGRPFAYGNQSASRLLEDIRYTAYPSGDISSEYGFSLFGEINSAVRSLYFDNLDKDTAAIAYAMFTGNTDFIETSTMDTFRYGGVAHVFAGIGYAYCAGIRDSKFYT